MANPYVNKVVYDGNTLIDLTADTVTADKLLKGYTAHSASGAKITGTYEGGSDSYAAACICRGDLVTHASEIPAGSYSYAASYVGSPTTLPPRLTSSSQIRVTYYVKESSTDRLYSYIYVYKSKSSGYINFQPKSGQATAFRPSLITFNENQPWANGITFTLPKGGLVYSSVMIEYKV